MSKDPIIRHSGRAWLPAAAEVRCHDPGHLVTTEARQIAPGEEPGRPALDMGSLLMASRTSDSVTDTAAEGCGVAWEVRSASAW